MKRFFDTPLLVNAVFCDQKYQIYYMVPWSHHQIIKDDIFCIYHNSCRRRIPVYRKMYYFFHNSNLSIRSQNKCMILSLHAPQNVHSSI